MSPPRRSPVGGEPDVTSAQSTKPLPLDPQATAPLVDFMPPADALPFRELPTAPMPPLTPPTVLAPLAPLVPPLPPRVPARSRVSLRTVAALALVVIEVSVLVYLVATWGR